MLTELHDYQITEDGIFQVWPTEGAGPYQFPFYYLLAWASNKNMSKYGAHEVDDFDAAEREVITVYSGPEGYDNVISRHTSEWWADVQEKDKLLLDYLNAEVTARRATMPAAGATEAEKEQGSADGLPII